MRSLFQLVADRLLEELPADADGNVRIALVTAPLEGDRDVDRGVDLVLDWEDCLCVGGCPRCVELTL